MYINRNKVTANLKQHKLTSPIVIVLFLLFLSGCAKDDIFIEPTTPEPVNHNIKNLSKYISSLGKLEDFEVVAVKTTVTGVTNGAAEYRSYGNGYDAGWYIPVTTTKDIFGKELKLEEPPIADLEAIWPGSILQGGRFINGDCAPIPIAANKRKPGVVRLDVVSGDSIKFFREVPVMSGANVVQAMNDILAPSNNNFAANVNMIKTKISSKSEMAYNLNLSDSELDQLTQGTFSSVGWDNKVSNKYMIKLRQVYFTMAYDYEGIEGTFTDKIKVSDFDNYSSIDNPPCYISSVSYGRYFIILYESDYPEDVLNSAMEKVYGSDKAQVYTNNERLAIKYAKVKFFQVGGNAEAGLDAVMSGDPKKINDFVVKGATFSKDNIGAVIDYSVRYLGNTSSISRGKVINTTSDNVSYITEPKMNNVKINISRIYSYPVHMDCTHSEMNYEDSNVEFRDIKITVVDKNGKVIKSRDLNPGIGNVRVQHATNRYYNNLSFTSGELGINTDKEIIIETVIQYFVERKVTEETEIYKLDARYYFDHILQKWAIRYDSSAYIAKFISGYQSSPFKRFFIRDDFNHAAIHYFMDINFSANRVTY